MNTKVNMKSNTGNHNCSQSDCLTYCSTSTSSDVDIEERIRTKATKFFKAYPKGSILNKRTPSSNSHRLDRAGTDRDTSSDSDKETKSLTAECHQTKHLKSTCTYLDRIIGRLEDINDIGKAQSTNTHERLKCTYQDITEMFGWSDSDDSTSETNISEPIEDPLRLDIYHHQTNQYSGTQSEDPEINTPSKSNNEDGETSPLKSTSTRPFKYYPEDPLTLTVGFDTAKLTINGGKPENYNEFRRRMLGNKYVNKSDTNKNMRRVPTTDTSSTSYREKRDKNNMASKRSRDARRAKEDELAVRCAYLEQENMFLKRKVAEMEAEKRKLRI